MVDCVPDANSVFARFDELTTDKTRKRTMMRKNIDGDRDGPVFNVTNVLAAIRRHKFLVFSFSVLGAAIAAFVSMRSEPVYLSKAQIMVEQISDRNSNLSDVVAGLPGDDVAIATQIKLLKSRRHIEAVIRDLNLQDDPDFRDLLAADEEDKEGWEWFSETLFSLLFDARSGEASPNPELPTDDPGADILLELADPASRDSVKNSIVRRFNNRLDVYRDGDTYIISVAYRSPNPELAATVANRFANLYIEQQLNDKAIETNSSTAWLEQRVRELGRELGDAEKKVEVFRADNGLLNAATTLEAEELSSLSSELNDIRANLSKNRSTLDLIRERRASNQNLSDIGIISDSSNLQVLNLEDLRLQQRETELSNTYGRRHPIILNLLAEREVITAKIEGEISKIIQRLADEVGLLEERERIVLERLGALRGEAAERQQAEITLRALEGEAESVRDTYREFLRDYRQKRERSTNVRPGLRVVSDAEIPMVPTNPGLAVMIVAGFCTSFALSTSLALFLEMRDRSIRNSGQVQNDLGMKLLANTPVVKKLNDGSIHQYLLENQMSLYTESIRSIYSTLKMIADDGESKVVMVTSSLSNEGKTTTALSLATLASTYGTRVLVVDFDLRHPSILKELGVERHLGWAWAEKGQNILEVWQDAVLVDHQTGLNVIQMLDLFSTAGVAFDKAFMRKLIDAFRKNYDLVVIDSAPIHAVVETRFIGKFVDHILFVVKWGDTTIDTARGALEHLREIEDKLMGAIVTQVDINQYKKYGNGDGLHNLKGLEKYYIN